MAEFLGTHITSMDAKPFDRVLARMHGGFAKSIVLTDEMPDTANGDYMLVAKVPVDATLTSIRAAFDDLGTAGTIDIGFYYKKADGTYAAVLAGAVANNIDVSTAAVALTEYRFSVLNIDTIEKAAWELAGLSARPAYSDLYIGLTTDTGTTVAGTVSMVIEFVV